MVHPTYVKIDEHSDAQSRNIDKLCVNVAHKARVIKTVLTELTCVNGESSTCLMKNLLFFFKYVDL